MRLDSKMLISMRSSHSWSVVMSLLLYITHLSSGHSGDVCLAFYLRPCLYLNTQIPGRGPHLHTHPAMPSVWLRADRQMDRQVWCTARGRWSIHWASRLDGNTPQRRLQVCVCVRACPTSLVVFWLGSRFPQIFCQMWTLQILDKSNTHVHRHAHTSW